MTFADVVSSLGAQIGAVRETGHAARADSTGQVMEALFGGWDHLATNEGATRQCRYALVTQMKEGMGEAVRAAERMARVKTVAEKRKTFALRLLASALSVFFVIFSVVTVLYVTSPPGQLQPDLRSELDTLSAQYPVEFHTLIVTLINLFSPVLIKVLVKLEGHEPEAEIRQTLIRQICLKMANLVVLYLSQKTGSVFVLLPRTDPAACYEADAAKTFINLIITDMMVRLPTSPACAHP